MFEKALKWLSRASAPDLSSDMPRDEAGLAVLARGLYDAIENLVGIESSATRTQHSRGETRLVDSLAVKCVKTKKSFDIDRLVWKFLVSVCSRPIATFSLKANNCS